ncbi:hypothetical protein GOBAR_DD04981 [Gossypium barbadense]|nr:hypothetical protein GOBAR_DD04981 [Gossypium barbadense]
MDFPSTQFVPSRMMGTYQPIHQIGMWGENFKSIGNPSISASVIVEVDNKLENESETASHEMPVPSCKHDQEASKPFDKIQRRLAQNREAARKSRLRKKAYVQQLESSRLKLIQLEKELEQAREQGLYIGGGLEAGHLGFSGVVNPGLFVKILAVISILLYLFLSKDSAGIAAFEMEYKHWMQVQNRQLGELRTALNAQISDIELRIVVENGMSHYFELFRMKSTVAKADVFYVMSGTWKTSAERFFSWIGGFRPSELLKVMHNIVAMAMEKLEALVCFVNQADHLRQETLQQMSHILTTRQAARGLLALGEYIQRLQDLSTLWATHPREPA